jgi:hypothetical protein
MTVRRLLAACACLAAIVALSFFSSRAARADSPATYAAFTATATSQHGLFTLWHKDGKLYIELAPDQLDTDFVQTIVPSNGTGGPGITWGNTDYQAADLVRFERSGNDVAILWPQPYFVAPHEPSSTRAIDASFAKSIVALAPIAAEDAKTGHIIVDASCFLDDQMNLHDTLNSGIPDATGDAAYTLDKDRSYFGKTKAFPENDVIEARQDWTSPTQRLEDVVPDPRHVQIAVTYNLAKPPENDGYVPRYADDRVGIYDDVYMSFDNDEVLTRKLRYAIRWNLRPSDPSKPVSPATHPMVFVMSDTIPEKYRPAIKAAVLKWNDALLKVGISDALQVIDQPKDPDFDPDDIRYNVLRWLTEERASFGADSQTLYDPRTGEEFRTGIVISADVPAGALRSWKFGVDPERYGRTTDPMPQKYLDDAWLATIMHETGHNLGMQHNFIGSRAYTAKELQDPAFTAKYGVASTVMEYAPLNLWPHGTPQGDYHQTVLGPYDYYAMQWAYGTNPGATTPEAEIPALRKLASKWSDPKYRYASDEDVSWGNGHASDPRVEQGILTNDPIGWCAVQLPMFASLMTNPTLSLPDVGDDYDLERSAITGYFYEYEHCATTPAHYIGGQYLSRAHRGDPGAEPPIVPVPAREQHRAFALMDRYLFGADAWKIPPGVLDDLGQSEWAGYGYGDVAGNYGQLPHWAYDPGERHDVAYSTLVGQAQQSAIQQMFLPIVLSRIVDGEAESRSDPMHLSYLFDWMHASVFGEIARGDRRILPLRRSLQANYMQTLVDLYAHPAAGVPSDARALAREELVTLEAACGKALRGDVAGTTRAHLSYLQALAHGALASGRPA